MSLPEPRSAAFAPSDDAFAVELLAAGAILTIDLDALAGNYRTVREAAPGAEAASLIKSDAYGLGGAPVARALWEAGCRTFFVAQAGEGASLRSTLPRAVIYVLNGLFPGTATLYRDHALRPCLSSLAEAEEWAAFCRQEGRLPAALLIDTGINRLGLSEAETVSLAARPDLLDAFGLTLVMSHHACADDAAHPLNKRQLERFERLRRLLPDAPASLANSAGIYLGPEHHFDLVRPGVAVFGGNPFSGKPNPFRPVVFLDARLQQVRTLAPGESVGYGATFSATEPRRIATLSAGYGDGLMRALSASGKGRACIGGHFAPIVGRISMDMINIDVTGVPASLLERGALVELLGSHITVDELAAACGTIGYEILTGLGRRYARVYKAGGRIIAGDNI
ncbi:MAG: alanine racemase [Parvibaculaceae bacterium]|nr:alanine racemase [Parvibaculaceae bacterium]